MITDSIQSMLANNMIPQLRPILRRRIVEALAVIDRECTDAGSTAEASEPLHTASENASPPAARVNLHFIYRAARDNGRTVAKRAPQVTDTRYWSIMFDRAG